MAHFTSGGVDDPRTATKYAASNYELKLSKPLTPTPGACADFACIVTRRERDRDGDMLEPSGCIVDEKMPLLLGHDMSKVVGKLVKVLTQNKSELTAHFAIADTELGRDAAKLAEFGALRISHGFKVLEATPWKDGSPGWLVSKFETVECSLVAVPALSSATLQNIQLHSKSFSQEGRRWVESLHQKSEFDRLWEASKHGRSRSDLANDDLYRSLGFLSPWEREQQWRSTAAKSAQPAVDHAATQQTLKGLRDVADSLAKVKSAMHDREVERACRELLGWPIFDWPKSK